MTYEIDHGVPGTEDFAGDCKTTGAADAYDADPCLTNRGGDGCYGVLIRKHVERRLGRGILTPMELKWSVCMGVGSAITPLRD